MTHYRLYFFDESDHISRALDIECGDDAEAVAVVRDHPHAFAIELWQGARRIERFAPSEARGFEGTV